MIWDNSCLLIQFMAKIPSEYGFFCIPWLLYIVFSCSFNSKFLNCFSWLLFPMGYLGACCFIFTYLRISLVFIFFNLISFLCGQRIFFVQIHILNLLRLLLLFPNIRSILESVLYALEKCVLTSSVGKTTIDIHMV